MIVSLSLKQYLFLSCHILSSKNFLEPLGSENLEPHSGREKCNRKDYFKEFELAIFEFLLVLKVNRNFLKVGGWRP